MQQRAPQVSSVSWNNWTFQLRAYVTWINSQLQKTDSRQVNVISDLRHDMKDGLILAELLKNLGGVNVPGIDFYPKTSQLMKENNEKILSFMAKKLIKVPESVSAKDITEGHIKSIMRLIQSIAAHYKPSCITSTTSANQDSFRQPNLRQSAVAARQVITRGSTTDLYNTLPRSKRGVIGYVDAVTDTRSSRDGVEIGPDWNSANVDRGGRFEDSTRQRFSAPTAVTLMMNAVNRIESPPIYENWPSLEEEEELPRRASSCCSERQIDGASYTESPCPSTVHCPELLQNISNNVLKSNQRINERRILVRIRNLITTFGEIDESLIKLRRSTSVQKKSIRHRFLSSAKLATTDEDLAKIVKSTGDVTQELSRLQSDLLNGKGKELETQEQAVQVSDESCNTESLSTLKEKLDEIDQNYQESRNQCQRLEDENDKLKESNTLLQNRLKELAHIQEDDKSRPNQHMVNDIRKQYMKKLEAKDDELLKFKIEMNDQDQLIKRQRSQLDETIKNLNAANKVKSNLTNRIADQDKKIARIELHSQHGSSAKNPVSREEMRIVRESLRSLRSNFTSNNPQQHTIDTVEQSIVTLMERFHSLEANTTSNNSSGPSDTRFPADHDPSKFNSYAAEKSSRGVKKSVLDMNTKTEDFTKVLYYTERGATPYLCHIPKRLGEVTLSDFKDVFDRPGSFRFHFKTMDPEFGMVKEEVIGDDDILPSIEGKIIGWVEEEN